MVVTEISTRTPTTTPTGEDQRLHELEDELRDLDRRVENNRLIRDTWTLIIFAIAVVALLASIIAVGAAMRAIDEAEEATAIALSEPILAALTVR